MQFYIGDYLRDTAGLTTEGHGAYLLLLMAMWNADGWVSSDPKMLARLARCTASRWSKLAPDIMPLLIEEDGRFSQKRLLSELKKASEKSIKRAEAGSLGGKSKALKTNNTQLANATALLQHSPEPEPEPERKKKQQSSLSLGPTDFEIWYRAYPKHVDRREAEVAYRKAIIKISPPILLAITEKFAEENRFTGKKYIPYPAKWLNRERWQTEEIVPHTPPKAAFEERCRKVFNGESVRMIRNFEITFGTDFEKAARRLEEFQAQPNPTNAAAQWFFNHGKDGCEVGTFF